MRLYTQVHWHGEEESEAVHWHGEEESEAVHTAKHMIAYLLVPAHTTHVGIHL